MEKILNELLKLGIITKTEKDYNTKVFDIIVKNNITNNCKLVSIDEISKEIIFEDRYGCSMIYNIDIFLYLVYDGTLAFKIIEPNTSVNLIYET